MTPSNLYALIGTIAIFLLILNLISSERTRHTMDALKAAIAQISGVVPALQSLIQNLKSQNASLQAQVNDLTNQLSAIHGQINDLPQVTSDAQNAAAAVASLVN